MFSSCEIRSVICPRSRNLLNTGHCWALIVYTAPTNAHVAEIAVQTTWPKVTFGDVYAERIEKVSIAHPKAPTSEPINFHLRIGGTFASRYPLNLRNSFSSFFSSRVMGVVVAKFVGRNATRFRRMRWSGSHDGGTSPSSALRIAPRFGHS